MKRLQLGALIAVVISLVGCKTDPRPPGGNDDYTTSQPTCIDHDGDGYGLNCVLGSDCDDTNPAVTNGCYVCDHPSPGCPCQTEQARSSCGKVSVKIGTTTTCAYGESVCTNGTWGDCIPDGKTTKTFDTARRTMGLAPAAPCGIACDPYCQQFPDTPDDSLSTPQGLLGTDGGLTLQPIDAGVRIVEPNGPMPGTVKAQLDDGGVFADAQPDAIIYHELPPAATAQDTVGATPVMTQKSVDVYFLEDNAGTMIENLQATSDAIKAPVTGTIARVLAAVPDARFGGGRFQQYDQAPWNDASVLSGTAVAFEHVLSPTADTAAFGTALQYLIDHNVEVVASPKSWMQALYAISTTGGLPGTPLPWVPPRAVWSSPPMSGGAESGACPAGTIGYPCFRPNAMPVTVVLTDTPSQNGPGGQYAYSRDAWNIAGAKLWSTVTPVAVPNNHNTEATAYPIDPTTFGIYTGNTNTQGVANASWGAATDPNQCINGRASTAKNVFFKFTTAQRTWYHFDPLGSAMTTNWPVLYLYRKDTPASATTWIDCNEFDNYDNPEQLPLSLDGVVDPGGVMATYYLVVDGYAGAEGPYVLHVGAMPDGAALGPVTEPNYDEAVAAYNAIGGKIVGVDGSGFSCDNSSHQLWLMRNTANSLEKLLRDTGSVDGGGNPYLLYLNNGGGLCHAADKPWGQQIADAILGVTANYRSMQPRGDVTAVAVDTDDMTDFDGPPGGPNQLTTPNIDDATFVASFATVPTAQTIANCTTTQADRYLGCLSGTPLTFLVNFQTPATVTSLPYNQIFTFVIRILRDGTTVLAEIPVVIVVPAVIPPEHTDAWFVRDFDTSTVCPMGTAPLWGIWAWNATTPGDSQIDYKVAVSPTAATLSMAPEVPLQFANPPGPTALAGQAIGVRAGMPNTQFGATIIDSTLAANMLARDSKALRIRAHLIPSSDGTLAPTLQTWNLQVSCQPAE